VQGAIAALPVSLTQSSIGAPWAADANEIKAVNAGSVR
jgi:hypothetical protein